MAAFVCTVRELRYQKVVTSGIFVDNFQDKCPQEKTKMASMRLKEGSKSYMVEVIAEFSL